MEEILSPQLLVKLDIFKKRCAEKGVDFQIFSTLRTLEEQAARYRVGRSHMQIKNKVYQLCKSGYYFLGEILENAETPPGSDILTHLCCGESFHSIGEAFDAYPTSPDPNVDGLYVYANDADRWAAMIKSGEEAGLHCGFNNKSLADVTHFQLRAATKLTRVYDPEKLKIILTNRNLL